MNIKYSFRNSHLNTEDKIFNDTLLPYIDHLYHQKENFDYNFDECSFVLPFDSKHREITTTIAEQYKDPDLGLIIVVGIGGSNLGTWAVTSALEVPGKHVPIFFVDTTDPQTIKQAITQLKATYSSSKKAALVAVSKSGTTAETISNFAVIHQEFSELEPELSDKVFVITQDGSPLWDYCQKQNIVLLDHISMVGGRYSVLSNVGLFPLALAGYDIEKLHQGAREAVNKSLSIDPKENPAVKNSLTLFQQNHIGKSIYNLFLFSKALENTGKWYRQLMGESIGKNGKGIMPIVSIGSVDLHSVTQLFFDGPDNIFTSFVSISEQSHDFVVRNKKIDNVVRNISKYSSATVFESIFEGVKSAYRKSDLPYSEFTFKKLDEQTLGEFMQFKMMEIMFLAKLMEVNAFDQPGVELYKEETRKILKKI